MPAAGIASAEEEALRGLRADVSRFFSDPAARRRPAPLYRRLVREAPVLRLDSMWLVSGFGELASLSTRSELRSFPSVRGRVLPLTPVPTLAKAFALMFPMRDGDDHRRLKGLAMAAFSTRRIARLRQLIEECVDPIVEQALARGGMDVVTDLATPLPVAVSTAMFDVPPADRSQVYEWALLVRRQLLRYDQDEAEIALVERRMGEFASYLRSLCDDRRRRPGDDLISELVSAADAGQLSDDELFAFILLLFVNGLETLTAALTMAVWELLQHPEEWPAVAGDRAYAEAVFDESVRLHSPVRFSARTLAEEVMLDGHLFRQGEVVALFYAAANRDPRRFPNPDVFDAARPRTGHLGFGHGAHYCLGAPLSLATGACVLERLARLGSRMSTDVTSATAAWSPALAFTTLESLPLRLAPVAT